MLTKDLIRYGRSGKIIKPQFIEEDNQILLDFAKQVINLYQSGVKRQVLEEQASFLANGFSDVKLAKGLNKICIDRCIFLPCDDLSEYRYQVFAKSFSLLNSQDFKFYQEFKNKMTIGEERKLYGDLAENDTIEKFKILTPRELLQRYNVSLVQSLLLYSSNILIEIEKVPISNLRIFFKYLRFFRLLFKISKIKTKYFIEINGAQSIFEQTQKYGLQLANFFPALLNLPHWKMTAFLNLQQDLQLKLSDKQQLIGHYSHFDNYIPQEIIVFEKNFVDKNDVWQIKKRLDIIQIKQILLIPDFSFNNKNSGEVIHLELFHRWHKFQLLERLENNYLQGYIIGIDRSLLKDKQIEIKIKKGHLQDKVFFYRDFPTAKMVLKMLKNSDNDERKI